MTISSNPELLAVAVIKTVLCVSPTGSWGVVAAVVGVLTAVQTRIDIILNCDQN